MECAAADQRQGWGPQVSVLVDLTPLLGAELGWETFGTRWPPKERQHSAGQYFAGLLQTLFRNKAGALQPQTPTQMPPAS